VAAPDYDEQGNNGVDSLHYLWCNTECQSAGGQWQDARVENGDNLQAEWVGAYPSACSQGTWHGLVPSLALDAAGQPLVAYDALFIARCIYDSSTGDWVPGGEYDYNVFWRTVRHVRFSQP
jgi:hypothetical protein